MYIFLAYFNKIFPLKFFLELKSAEVVVVALLANLAINIEFTVHNFSEREFRNRLYNDLSTLVKL